MDAQRFDRLARAFSAAAGQFPTRRVLLRTLGLGVAGFAVGVGRALETEAKKGRRKQRKKKKNPCLFGQRRCRDGHCHGCCSNAQCGENVCQSGTCSACPANERLCRGGCIAEEACCTDSECTGGRVCAAGTCACGPNERECDGFCIAKTECCGDDCPECSSGNCDGCCQGHVCERGDSQNFCGRGGDACIACGSHAECNAGSCSCEGSRVMCADGDCINCRPRETCGAGNACQCPTECCGDEDCTQGAAGRCKPDGACIYRPDCTSAHVELPGGCSGSTHSLCCSDVCWLAGPDANTCVLGCFNNTCRINTDCESGECRYYRCT